MPIFFERLLKALVIDADRRELAFYRRDAVPYSSLIREVIDFSARLQDQGIGPGSHVGVLCQNNHQGVVGLLSVVFTGATLVPLPTLMGGKQKARLMERVKTIISDAHIDNVVCSARQVDVMQEICPGIACFVPGDDDVQYAYRPVRVHSDDIALLQYTSGSTACPKGVILTQQQLSAGVESLIQSGRFSREDKYFSWLPLSHDMGLISLLAAFLAGTYVCLSAPSDFIKSPKNWLAAFAKWQASVYVGPNFSYQYMLDSIDDKALSELDLSHVRLMLNGAEQIDFAVLQQFQHRFAVARLAAKAMLPVYGMAEATLAVSFPALYTPVAKTNPNNNATEPVVVGVGRAVAGMQIKIDGHMLCADCPETGIAEIEISGPAVMSGYWRNGAIDTQDIYTADDGQRWFKTGDLGCLRDGQLFVVGRKKEVIKHRGMSLFPEDIERHLRILPDVFRARCVAASIFLDHQDCLCVLVETRSTSPSTWLQLKYAMQNLVEEFGFENWRAALCRANCLPTTTSGKLQRTLAARQLMDGQLSDHIIDAFGTAAHTTIMRSDVDELLPEHTTV